MENKSNKIKAVSSPLSFAKQDFASWINTIKEGITDHVEFGTPWFVNLSDKVREPDIKKVLFYYDNETYCYTVNSKSKKKTAVVTITKVANGIPFKIDLQLLISNNRTEEKPIATICIVFKLKNGKLSKPILLDSKAKSKPADFIQAVNRTNNRLLFNLDDETFILLKEKINQQKTDTTLVFKNAGNVKYGNLDGRLYQNCYVDSNGVIKADEDGTIYVNDCAIKLDDSYKDKLPKLYLGEVDIKDLLQNFFLQAERVYKNRLDIFLALGTSIMTIFIDNIWIRYPGFPVIYLYGATKQGKAYCKGL